MLSPYSEQVVSEVKPFLPTFKISKRSREVCDLNYISGRKKEKYFMQASRKESI
jgi:hypothetical protein